MEARVYFNNGVIEAHHIPDYVGGSSTSSEGAAGNVTSNDIDRVNSIVERFVRDGEGFWLERVIDKPADIRLNYDGTKFTKTEGGKTAKRLLVVPNSAIGTVKLIAVDGEQVYPEVQEDAREDASYFGALGF